MLISEATRKALEQKGCITYPDIYGSIKIKPSNSYYLCSARWWDGRKPHRWEPSADELIRDDWVVVPEKEVLNRDVRESES